MSSEEGGTDRYLDAHELSRRMGISVRTVERWTAEGMPSESWGMRVRRYQFAPCVQWARQRASRIEPATLHMGSEPRSTTDRR
jgi:phage terminase Nu1 subunit (DNA packaging protein)